MKKLAKILFGIYMAVAWYGEAHAGCKYVYVNGQAHWVCDYNSGSSNCGYVYVNGNAVWVCN